MATIKIARGTDPFKKYWWVILLGFSTVGAVICLPALNGGSQGAAAEESGLQLAESSLDSVENPNGAAGGVIDLTMEGRTKKESSDLSSLYQAPSESGVAASTAPTLAAAPQTATLADALKDVTRASAASAKVEAGGWGERAQRGWSAPKAALSSMGGLGGGGGSTGASMAAGQSGGAGSGGSSFGSGAAKVGSTNAKGLKDTGDTGKEAPTAMGRLNNAHAVSQGAALNASADGARSSGGSTFDGKASATRSLSGGGADGGFFGALDAAPSNLKGTDFSKNNQKKITAPPLAAANASAEAAELRKIQMEAQMKQMMMSMIMAGIMSVVGL